MNFSVSAVQLAQPSFGQTKKNKKARETAEAEQHLIHEAKQMVKASGGNLTLGEAKHRLRNQQAHPQGKTSHKK